MTKHIADHRSAPANGRLHHFLRIARDKPDAMWRASWSRPLTRSTTNRRVVEFMRIAHGKLA